MTAFILAQKLNGCNYSIPKDLVEEAKASNLVIVYGQSDDLIEIDGAISEEVGAYEGGTVYFHGKDIVEECDDACTHCNVEELMAKSIKVEAKWDVDGYSWVMVAPEGLDAVSFDMMDDDEKYCKGIVFSLDKLGVEN